ncbi:small acidic protein 1-like [Macadamia integrifolia]|uniref:small acidic protein 1-like n=1 Tax=Macadamia integrifolia TaxID=60698 RepID=UPI001C4F6AAE|nr:small acidic protein 1-like [Macadamia integrifolia]
MFARKFYFYGFLDRPFRRGEQYLRIQEDLRGRVRIEQKREMKPSPTYFGDFDDHGSTVAMDVDDADPLEMLAEGVVNIDNKLADSDFFNAFEDDFDDSDIN